MSYRYVSLQIHVVILKQGMRGQNQTRLGRLRARSESNTPLGQRPGEFLELIFAILKIIFILQELGALEPG